MREFQGGSVTCGTTTIYTTKMVISKTDRDNRKMLINTIEKFLKEGKTLEEACEVLAQDAEIKNKFKYYPKNVDLKTIFASWYNGKTREKREIEKGRI